ncbi:MAG: alanine--glyoxylate aminotransferase family protein [Phycisphaerales bacterium]|nr:alanine--glyoxylate aminotransferase family protein [Phycisphaerales bacterium]
MLMKYRLFTPGPTSVPEATLLELAKPVHHHRTGEFRAMFKEVQSLLQYVYQTTSMVHTITGSGTAAAEAGIVNTIAPGQKVLNISNGKFAERWAQVCKTYGIDVKELKLEYGQHVSPDQIAQELKSTRYDAVILVHSETSTATTCDLEAIGKVIRASGETLLIVDGITSIGAMPFKMDAWGVDVAITGSQKALMLPPGLAFVSLSERAWAAVDKNKSRQDFYLDLKKYKKSLADGDTPFTPANTLIEALRVSLNMVKEETLEGVWKRTHTVAESFRQGMKALGFELFSQQPADSVSAIRYPQGIVDKEFRGLLKSKHNIHIAGGQGTMEGQIFRVNHMGYTDAYDALAVVAAIEHVIKALGKPAPFGAGVAAAQKILGGLF